MQLYEALHVGEHQVLKERELHEKLEELNVKLGPLEKVTHANCFGQTNKADYIAGFMLEILFKLILQQVFPQCHQYNHARIYLDNKIELIHV